MRFSIISEIPGRTRLQLAGPVPESDLDALLKLGGDIDGVHKVRVYGRIGQMALEYDEPCRDAVLAAVGALDAQAIADAKTGYVMQLEPRKHKLVMDLATLVGAHYARRWFLPAPLRAVFVVAGYMAFLRAALRELAQPRLTVPCSTLRPSAFRSSSVMSTPRARRCSCSMWANCSRTTPAP